MASWDGEPSEALAREKKLKTRVPIGMGIVVPAYRIAETLNQPELVMARQKEYEQRANEEAATMDSLPSSEASLPANGENPNHREDFTRLVNAAARKPAPKD
jgi:hypothetical protein